MQMTPNLKADLYATKDESKRRALITKIRTERFVLFRSLLSSLPRPVNILDVGGTQQFWEFMECIDDGLKIVVYNVRPLKVTLPNFTSMLGAARDMKEFRDKEFDIAFS